MFGTARKFHAAVWWWLLGGAIVKFSAALLVPESENGGSPNSSLNIYKHMCQFPNKQVHFHVNGGDPSAQDFSLKRLTAMVGAMSLRLLLASLLIGWSAEAAEPSRGPPVEDHPVLWYFMHVHATGAISVGSVMDVMSRSTSIVINP